jgi:hypothetical protein
VHSTGPKTGPRLQAMGCGGLPRAVGRNSHEAAAWRLGPAVKTARVARGKARVPAWSPRANCTQDGTVARRWEGVAGYLEGSIGEVPGKEERAGVHRNGVPTVRRRKQRLAAAFNGDGVAPVVVDECGEVLQLEGDPGVRRQWSIEDWGSLEGAHRRGADGGDVWTESGAEEGLRWRKTGVEDAWVMGMKERRSGVDE